MKNHLRGNVTLFLLTVGICCVLYPGVMLALGRGLFPGATSGGIVTDANGARGARGIAQPFASDEYFWPRPSAASYYATASGGGNLGANNPSCATASPGSSGRWSSTGPAAGPGGPRSRTSRIGSRPIRAA